MNDQLKHEAVNDEPDSTLTRLFAEQREALSGEDFLQTLLPRLQREYQMQQVRRWCVALVVMITAALIAPWVTRATLGLLSLPGKFGQFPDTLITAAMVLVTVGVLLWNRRRI
jgi:uncharacterized sodium:solute symporter family permease YidK